MPLSVTQAPAGSLQGYGPYDTIQNGAVVTGGYSAPAYSSPTDATYYDPYSGYSGGGTYSSGTSTATATPQPTAQALADYNALKTNTYNSIGDAVNNSALGYKNTILDFLDTTRSGENKINNASVQNELSRLQGNSGVLDMVGRGIRSGGVMLANKNATDSSASEALARAYGDIGRREMTKVGNQYALGKNTIQGQQDTLDTQINQGVRHISENKTNIINKIVSDTQTAIAQLNQAAADASLPDRIDIEAKKQQIKAEAIDALQAYDQSLNSGIADIKPADINTNLAKATALNTAGTAADNAFNFSSSVPAQFQDTGPFASELPLFRLPTKKTGA